MIFRVKLIIILNFTRMVKTIKEKSEPELFQSDNINDYIGYTDYKPPR